MTTATNFKNQVALPDGIEYKFFDTEKKQLVGCIAPHGDIIIVVNETEKRYATHRSNLRWATPEELANTLAAQLEQQRAAMSAAAAKKAAPPTAAAAPARRDDLPELPANYVPKKTTRKKTKQSTPSLW